MQREVVTDHLIRRGVTRDMLMPSVSTNRHAVQPAIVIVSCTGCTVVRVTGGAGIVNLGHGSVQMFRSRLGSVNWSVCDTHNAKVL